jgi:hypothetical protein
VGVKVARPEVIPARESLESPGSSPRDDGMKLEMGCRLRRAPPVVTPRRVSSRGRLAVERSCAARYRSLRRCPVRLRRHGVPPSRHVVGAAARQPATVRAAFAGAWARVAHLKFDMTECRRGFCGTDLWTRKRHCRAYPEFQRMVAMLLDTSPPDHRV